MKIMHVIKILHGIYVDLKKPKADKKRVNTLYVFKYCKIEIEATYPSFVPYKDVYLNKFDCMFLRDDILMHE